MKLKYTAVALALGFAGIISNTASAATITVAYDADPVTIDPVEQISAGVLQMAHLIFDPLVRYDNDLNFEPRLATSWENISDTVTRFHLRKGVKFHSGNTMTADDVIFSLERYKASPDYKAIFEPYEKMVKVDDYTVDLIAKKPYPLVLPNATYLFVMDKKFYSGKTEDGRDRGEIAKNIGTFASTHASGTGPFVMQEREQGVKNVYAKFDGYWGKTGNVDKVVLVPIKEDATRVSALLAGDVDMVMPVPPTDVERVKKAKGKNLYSLGSNRVIVFQMNQKVNPEFKDVRVRQAFNYAVNNDGIVKKIMRGFATTAAQMSPKGYLGYDEKLKPQYDLAKAKQLMKEAGYENGFTVSMIAPNNRYVNDEKVAQAVVAMLAKIKVKVNLTTMPKAQYWGEYDKCDNGLLMIGWSTDTGDSANYSEFLTATKNPTTGAGSYNCGYYSNARLDQLLAEANSTLDSAKRREMLQEVSNIEYNDAAQLMLHKQNLAWGYSDRLTTFKDIINLNNFPYYGDLVVKE